MTFELTEDTFIMYAMKYYDNPYCKGMAEFLDDIKRLKYVKRLLGKYHSGKELKERLIFIKVLLF